ncbi:MAG: TetR family transcriptional regulator [Acidimicrobiales bacterium]|nr:TetR family transcriptional regulator [Acidimicrobiales bacterium]
MPRSPEPARQALVAAAEALFAARGVDAVPVGDVVKEAGQRNSSAVQYHFESKQGLLQAVMEPHQTRIDAARLALLDEIDDAPSVEMVVDVFVRPLAALLQEESGRNYLMIQAQLVNVGDLDAVLPLRPGLARAMVLLTEAPSDADPDSAAHRNTMIAILLLHGLADFARRRPDAENDEREAFTRLMDASITAIIKGT